MKKILKYVYSPRTTLGLLVIFGIAMAVATFIENSYDTDTSKVVVYNARWFEAVMILMIINFIGTIKRYDMLSFKKISGFIFHFAFVIMIVGAGLTRYIGFEGTMHIREGQSSNFLYSRDTYLTVKTNEGGNENEVNKKLMFSMISDNSFEVDAPTVTKGDVNISFNKLIRKAQESYVEGETGGFTQISLMISENSHKHDYQIRDGQTIMVHNFPITFNNPSYPGGIHITGTPDEMYIKYSQDIETASMPAMTEGLIPGDSLGAFTRMMLYKPANTGMAMVLTGITRNTKIEYVEGNEDQSGPDALILDVEHNGKSQEVTVLGGSGYLDNYVTVPFDGFNVSIAYGSKNIPLSFALELRKFELDRYAGSMSPSSYASEVTLVDPQEGVREDHRIYMNNVLDYKGYRFFQSSYDRDEKGTVLSVNSDRLGTWVTYLGYALMILGFIWTLFNPKSRYWELMVRIKKLRQRRKELAMIALMIFSTIGWAQDDGHNHAPQQHNHQTSQFSVSSKHADEFASLIVQTYEGRFAPVHTLAVDVLHKIGRKDYVEVPGRGRLTAVQWFLDMPLNAEFWKQQKMIYVREKPVMDAVGLVGKHASFADFFNQDGSYKLQEYAETAFRKTDAERNKFDKEIIKVNERLEVFMMAFRGQMLKIFPVAGDVNNKWISWDDPVARTPITGSLTVINDDLQLAELNYSNIMRTYFMELVNASRTAEYTKADRILGYLKSIQRQSNAKDIIPSEKKLKHEISYNESNIFINLKNLYALLSVLLLFLTFIDNLKAKKSKILNWTMNILIGILALGFLYHTYGMAMRWYLAGHAPWSNGYEALILVAWSALLAGFSFMRYSKITLAATSLLAFFTLMTASHSSYDPQLTNLVPVLKSYWLIIHVATLTISYGFLGLGFVLGLFNMVLYLFKNQKNGMRLSLITRELTYVNEMNITIGLLLATVGTFLGGVWANESWGRYWGWDAKETWALIITIVYTIIIHLRLAPKVKGEFIFNVATILGFGSVLMTFIGVNYYFTKGMHSYAQGDTPVFPIWAWISILAMMLLIVVAGFRYYAYKKTQTTNVEANGDK